MSIPAFQLIQGAYIADTARVFGDVTLADDVNIWFGVSIRGDVAAISIGTGTNVQDNAVIHCDYDVDNVIGSHVIIGHSALLHGRGVGGGTLVGMQATLLSGTRVGKGCLIAAGALLPPGMQVPDHSVVMGMPGKIVRQTTEQEKESMAYGSGRYLELAKLYCEQPADPRVHRWGV